MWYNVGIIDEPEKAVVCHGCDLNIPWKCYVWNCDSGKCNLSLLSWNWKVSGNCLCGAVLKKIKELTRLKNY